jgi:outer membrane usher protein FimD/PapC
MLGTFIPDMGAEVAEGDHPVVVTISLNGQQFNHDAVHFQYKSVDPNLTEEELKKMDEEDAKGAKKPAKKK